MADIKTNLAKSYFERKPIRSILQIGCGGTGSLLAPHIARAIASNEETKKIKYVLMDGDKVADKNLTRQNFILPNVGSFKSDVLAKRYSLTFGINISSISEYVKDNFITPPFDMIISCVDNNSTRKIICDSKTSNNQDSILIDAGNELLGGQVFVQGPYLDEDEIHHSTDLLEIHPEIGIKKDKLPTELSCAERVNSGEQSLGVNLTASTILFNVANSFIRQQTVYYYEVDFTAKNSFSKKMLDNYPCE